MDTEAPRRRGDAKERLLQLAEVAVLEKGFAGTSIEELIAAAGITKSGFFYHFKDKTELAAPCSPATSRARTRCSTISSRAPTNSTTIRCMASSSG